MMLLLLFNTHKTQLDRFFTIPAKYHIILFCIEKILYMRLFKI